MRLAAWRSLGMKTGTLAALRAGNGAVVAVAAAPLAVPSCSCRDRPTHRHRACWGGTGAWQENTWSVDG